MGVGIFILGTGLSILFFFARYYFKEIPDRISEAGMVAGVLTMLVLLLEESMRPPLFSILLGVIGLLFLGAAIHFYAHRNDGKSTGQASAPVPEAKPAPEERVFTDRTIRQLRAYFVGRTALQAQAFIAEHLNKWIRTQGNATGIYPRIAVLRSTGPEDDLIECHFAESWNAKLATFRQGDLMRVIGRISPNQNGAQVYLLDCEIRD